MSYELVLADCHEWIKTLEDNSISAVITDPPYHTTQLAFDKLEVRWSELWPEIYRVCKPSAVQVMFSAQPFTTDLINSNRKRFRYPLVWDKAMPTGFLDAKRKPLRVHEDILVFAECFGDAAYIPQMGRGSPKGLVVRSSNAGQYAKHERVTTYNSGERYPTSILSFSNGDQTNKQHPTQKPLELLCYLVKTYSNPGDTVLDLFVGSGTTAHACLLTDRNFLGCEIDPVYHSTASKRLAAVAAQSRLEFA